MRILVKTTSKFVNNCVRKNNYNNSSRHGKSVQRRDWNRYSKCVEYIFAHKGPKGRETERKKESDSDSRATKQREKCEWKMEKRSHCHFNANRTLIANVRSMFIWAISNVEWLGLSVCLSLRLDGRVRQVMSLFFCNRFNTAAAGGGKGRICMHVYRTLIRIVLF